MPVPVAQEQIDLPQVFGRYLLLRRLSRGGMGEIFLARLGEIQGFEKPVIIKKILPNLSADEEFIKRFIDEAQVAIKLNHANIAPVYEVGKVDGDYFLAIEYIEGRDLRRLLSRAYEEDFQVPPDLCFYIARDLAAGLGYAHRRTDVAGNALSVVHCDISPPNVMVSFEGEVKIIDFGISKSAIRIAGSNPNMGFGKFGYMAPEQLIRGGIIDRRTDIYAAGVVLYELLTGERLYEFPEGADYKQIARIVSRGEFKPVSVRRPGLDPSLDPIVAKALASKSEERYQTAEEFRDALQGKLSQMNPTISADVAARLMRKLFSVEVEEERALVVSTAQFDVSGFREELTGSVEHTVTFARAGTFVKKDGAASSSAGAQPAHGSANSSPVSAAAKRMRGLALALAPAVAALFLLAIYLGRSGGKGDTSAVGAAAPKKAAAQARSQDAPTVTPLPRTPRSEPAAHHPHVAAQHAREEEPEEAPKPAAAKSAPSDDAVVAKFRSVKGEYETFKTAYGDRLESQWNAIASEITFGKPGEKYARVNSMLDTLRKDMAKVRTGG